MIQTVGIRFQAEGLDVVSRQMKVLASGVKSLVTGIKNLENLDTSKAITNLNRLALGMGNAASKLTMAANEINAAVTAFTGANAAVGRGRPGGVVGGDAHSSSRKPDLPWYSPTSILATTGNLAKYSTAFGLLYGTKTLAEQALLGKSRQDLLDPQLNLHAIGYKTQAEKRDVEYAAGDASRFYRGTIKKEEFMKSLAEMGSALPHDDPNAPAMNKQTHIDLAKTAISFGKMSQMTVDASSQLLESLIAAQYYMGRPELKQNMRERSGFASQYASEVAGQAYKAIDIYKMRGQDVAESMKYLAPSMVAKGWQLSDVLTLTGYATTVGMKANMFSRGMKSFLDAKTGDIGEILLAGSTNESVSKNYKGLKPKEQKALGEAEYAKYDKMMSNDLIGFLAKVLSPAWERALSRGFNAKEFSGTDFLQSVRAILMKSSAEELLKARELIESGKRIDVIDEHKRAIDQDPAATNLSTLDASLNRFNQAAADSTGPLSRLGTGITDMTSSVIDALSRWQEWTNKFNRELLEDKKFNSSADIHSGAYTPWAEDELDKPDGIKPMFTKLLNIKDKAIADIYDRPFSPLMPMQHFGQSNFGMSMFNVPNVAPQMDQGKTTHEVRGQAEVEVKINDQGFFDKVRALIDLIPTKTTFAGGGLENSTGRHTPTIPQ